MLDRSGVKNNEIRMGLSKIGWQETELRPVCVLEGQPPPPPHSPSDASEHEP